MATEANSAPYSAPTGTSSLEDVPASSSGDRHRELATRVLGGVGAALAFCAMVLIVTTLVIRWRRGRSRKGSAESRSSGKKRSRFCSNISICNSGQLLSETLSQTPKKHIHFSIDDLVAATNAFDEATVVGEGGFGKVYRGVLVTPPFSKVAIKVLTGSSSQGVREFITEIEVLSKLDHKHLVRLLGSCMVDEQLLLVYRHVANGSLSDHLHGDNRQSRTTFPWAKRVKIALGAALGVQHLHAQNPSVLHRDVKAANILLTRGFNAKVCDFGFAKQLSNMPDDGSSARFCLTPGRSGAIGTLGYVAPESMMTGEVSSASDVYSFGVVMLELLTGRKPLDFTKPEKDQSLVKWARILLDQERIAELIDPPLLEELPRVRDSALLFLRIARLCLEMDSRARPTMGEVVETLRMIKADYDRRPESVCINLSDSDTASEISAERSLSEISLRSDDRNVVEGSCCLDQFWKQRFQGGDDDCEDGRRLDSAGDLSRSVKRRSTSEPINISRPLSWLLLGLNSSKPPTPPRGY